MLMTDVQGFNNGLIRDPKVLQEKAKRVSAALSPQQREFCHAMLTAESQTAAAIAAGYSPQSARSKASQLLILPEVQEYLGILALMRAQAAAIDAAQIIALQLQTYYEARDKDNLTAANVALDQLAKMSGLYKPLGNSKLATELPTAKEFKEMSKDERNDELEEMMNILNETAQRKTLDNS